jgi:hypothetical protein
LDLIRTLRRAQRETRAVGTRETASLSIAATHALSFTFFPGWIRKHVRLEALATLNLISDSREACEEIMLAGEACSGPLGRDAWPRAPVPVSGATVGAPDPERTSAFGNAAEPREWPGWAQSGLYPQPGSNIPLQAQRAHATESSAGQGRGHSRSASGRPSSEGHQVFLVACSARDFWLPVRSAADPS